MTFTSFSSSDITLQTFEMDFVLSNRYFLFHFVFILSSYVTSTNCDAVSLYVSPKGLDSNSGSNPSSPFKTLHKAVEVINQPNLGDKEVFVELMEGYHDLSLQLNVTQGYTSSVTFRSYQHQEVHITGGKRIDPGLFKHVTDQTILNRIPQEAHEHVRQLYLRDAGISDPGKLSPYGFATHRLAPLELFINGAALRLARWPNDFYINIVGTPEGQNGTKFLHNSTRDSRWVGEKDPWVYGFWYWSWADLATPVENIDAQLHEITLKSRTRYGLRTGNLQTNNTDVGYSKQGGYFRVINMLSELDQPGEYYIDRSTGILYMWPNTPTGYLQQSDIIYASILDDCIALNDRAQNINFQDFTLEACRRYGIRATNAFNSTFTNLELKNTGSYGVVCSGDCRNITVSRCEIHDTDGGISVDGGVRYTLTPSGNVIEDNHIWRVGRVTVIGADGITHAGVNNLIRYNHVHNATYSCIFWGGNDHVMEFNYFQDCVQNASDGGAVHCDRDWTMRGNHIRYNYFHNSLRYWPGANVRGIMLDDEFSSVAIEHNIFTSNEIHTNIGGGRDNIINYNIFYNATGIALIVDGRGLRGNHLDQLEEKLKQMPYTDTLWSQRYPLLAAMAKNNKTHGAPEGNQIHTNIYYTANTTGLLYYKSVAQKIEYFNVTNNKQAWSKSDFVSPDDNNFDLRGELKQWAVENGFEEPVPFNKVGPRFKTGPYYLHV